MSQVARERKTQWLLAHCSTLRLHSSPMHAIDKLLKEDSWAINTPEHANTSNHERFSEEIVYNFNHVNPFTFFSPRLAPVLKPFRKKKNTSVNHSFFTLGAWYTESSLNYWGRRFIWLSVFECDNFPEMSVVFFKGKKKTTRRRTHDKSSAEKPQMRQRQRRRAFTGRLRRWKKAITVRRMH